MRHFVTAVLAMMAIAVCIRSAHGSDRGDAAKVKVHQEVICGLEGSAVIDIDGKQVDDLLCEASGILHVDKWFQFSSNNLEFRLHDVPKDNQDEVYQQCKPQEPSQQKPQCIIKAIINEYELNKGLNGASRSINHFDEVHVKKVSF